MTTVLEYNLARKNQLMCSYGYPPNYGDYREKPKPIKILEVPAKTVEERIAEALEEINRNLRELKNRQKAKEEKVLLESYKDKDMYKDLKDAFIPVKKYSPIQGYEEWYTKNAMLLQDKKAEEKQGFFKKIFNYIKNYMKKIVN